MCQNVRKLEEAFWEWAKKRSYSVSNKVKQVINSVVKTSVEEEAIFLVNDFMDISIGSKVKWPLLMLGSYVSVDSEKGKTIFATFRSSRN